LRSALRDTSSFITRPNKQSDAISLMSKILILIAGHLCTAPRAQKEADTLAAAGHDVVVRGAWFDAELVERDLEFMTTRQWRFDPILDLRPTSVAARSRNLGVRARGRLAREVHTRFGKFSPSQLGFAPGAMLKAALSEGADLTIVHSEAGLWVGEQLLRKGMRVGVDFEDWFSEDLLPQDRIGRPVKEIRSYEAELMKQCDYRVTTSHALAQALAEAYAAPAPEVIYNVFPFADRAKIDGETRDRSDPRIPSLHWFSQTIGQGRGLETLLASLNHVSVPVEIHLRGNCTEQVLHWLNELTPAAWRERVFIHPTVSSRELLSRIAEHDIGLALEIPYCRNKDLTASNKLFQYLQAGLAAIATNTAGQREVFERRPNIGTLIPPDDPDALARAIGELLSDAAKLSAAKAAAVRAAEEEFCWEEQQHKLLMAAEAALEAKAPTSESAKLRFATAS
jgi:glycosyltransferase involved in cell wall biosynthesis